MHHNQDRNLTKAGFTEVQAAEIKKMLRTMLKGDLSDHRRRQTLRDLALFSFAVDAAPRSCDLVNIKVKDVIGRDVIRFKQKKTKELATAKITPETRKEIEEYIRALELTDGELFVDITTKCPLKSTSIKKIVKKLATMIGLDPAPFGAHSLRKTKVGIICRSGVSLDVGVKLARGLGHKSVDSLFHYLGIAAEEAADVMASYKIG